MSTSAIVLRAMNQSINAKAFQKKVGMDITLAGWDRPIKSHKLRGDEGKVAAWNKYKKIGVLSRAVAKADGFTG